MRKIGAGPIAVFASLATAEVAMACALTWLVDWAVGDYIPVSFRGIVAIALVAILTLALALCVYRVVLNFCPIPAGNVPPGSREEFWVFVYLLEFLMIFNSPLFARSIPVPLMRLYLQALGGTFGTNSYSAGVVFDPYFVSVGNDTILGFGSALIPHELSGDHLSFAPIKIGHRVTVGTQSTIMQGVTIGDDAKVAAQSVVTKGTTIGAGELWGGVPARRLKGAHEPSSMM